ncbi:MAG TPA: shikimate dehydrogenase [Candidatus Stackebrandtia excrementipullorum]|nr:shikimate dehydrogenase [Candidatus Stackebrandtia excrementipullorum]
MTRHAAVLGSPVAHSLSPLIHRAGYDAAGLSDWRYQAIECIEAELPRLLARCDETWMGFSVTMPLKTTALAVADTAGATATALAAANTLVRSGDGWHAENTDAPGMVDALTERGVTNVSRLAVLGAGGTARAALGAAAALKVDEVVIYARRRAAVADLAPVAERLNVALRAADWSKAADAAEADLVVSTVPKGVSDDVSIAWKPTTVLFDVLYDPWPTPLATTALAAGCRVLTGLDLLLAQAVRQFEMFTGIEAPVMRMREALELRGVSSDTK